MNGKVLVAFGSKHGATEEIAEKIGETLERAGFPVDVVPVANVRDISGYAAVVLGSAAYIGQWRKDAAKFLKQEAGKKLEKVLGRSLRGLLGGDERQGEEKGPRE